MLPKLCGFIFWTSLMLTQARAVVIHSKDAGSAAAVGIIACIIFGIPMALVFWFLIRREKAGVERRLRLRKSMYRLRELTGKLGSAQRDSSKSPYELCFGKTKVNDNFDIVDAIGREDPGMTATLFLKEEGTTYIAVTSSVLKPDGVRAIGSVMNQEALAAIKQGKEFSDKAKTELYAPIIKGEYSHLKETIGAYHVGSRRI